MEDLDVLRSAYLEAQQIRTLAWKTLTDAEIAQSGLSVGDKFITKHKGLISKNLLFSQGREDEKIFEVTDMHVRFTPFYGMDRADEGGTFEVRAAAYPIKKDGTVSSKGEMSIWDVDHAIKNGAIKVIGD